MMDFKTKWYSQEILGSKGTVNTWDITDSIHPIGIYFSDNTKVTNMPAYYY